MRSVPLHDPGLYSGRDAPATPVPALRELDLLFKDKERVLKYIKAHKREVA